MSEINMNELLVQMKSVAAAAAKGAQPLDSAAGEQVPGFNEMLKQSIDTVNNLQTEAKNLTQAFELGDKNVSLAEVMIAKEKASVSFQTMLQVRNKLVEAYRDIMSTQV
jgi:flagellar hook-basal body complex protein FliE